MTAPTVHRCGFPGCSTLTTGERCVRHTATESWVLVRRMFLSGDDGHVLTLRLPPFEPGDTVPADIVWQGPPPAADDERAQRALKRQLNALARELGVLIEVAGDE